MEDFTKGPIIFSGGLIQEETMPIEAMEKLKLYQRDMSVKLLKMVTFRIYRFAMLWIGS